MRDIDWTGRGRSLFWGGTDAMTPGYITLDHFTNVEGTGWRKAHPHLTVDMSEPRTAEVKTVDIVPILGTSSTTTYMARPSLPHRGYRGSHAMEEESRIWWFMVGAGIAFMILSVLSVVAISVFVF